MYRRGDSWYLMIAEDGTERGHAVSVARGQSPVGPFEGHPANPVLSARSTSCPIQNTGHADLVSTPDGAALVMLGMRPLGLPQSFPPLGRETFITPVSWAGGWPQPEPVLLAAREAFEEEVFDFAGASALEDPGWLAVRTIPAAVASIGGGRLSINGRSGLGDPHPQFVGRRQRHLTATVSATVDASAGAGRARRTLRREPLDRPGGPRHGRHRPGPARGPRAGLAGHRTGRRRRTAHGDEVAAGRLHPGGDGR